jgi:hypothetical protein
VFSGVVVCIIDFASIVVENMSESCTKFATVTGARALVRIEYCLAGLSVEVVAALGATSDEIA